MKQALTLAITLTFVSLAFGAGCSESGLPDELAPLDPEPAQLETARFFGEPVPTAVARRSLGGVIQIIDGFVAAKTEDRLDALVGEATEVYAGDAAIFQSLEFMSPDDVGPNGFVDLLDYLYTEVGQGQDALRTIEVCNVYASQPDQNDDTAVEWLFTSQASVPGSGVVVATARMSAQEGAEGWRLTYHDFDAEPAPNEDCTGLQVQKIHGEQLCLVAPESAECL